MADADAGAPESGRGAHERAVRVRMVATERPASIAVALDASEALMKRDGKDIHKRSSARKSRYAMVFPGHVSVMREGKIGEMREMHTQSPVVYLDFERGRVKMLGTIVRPKSTRYFTLNAKSKDRMNLEEWFDSVILFPTWYWIGTKEENPEEKPLPLPAELGDLSGEAEADWVSSVAAGNGGTSAPASQAPAKNESKGDASIDDGPAMENEGGRRPRRQAAAAARKKMYADDSDAASEDGDEEEDDGRVASPIVVRGKVESFIPAPSPIKTAAPVRQSVAAPVRRSVSAPSRASLSAPKRSPAKRQKREDPIVIDSEDDDDDAEDDDSDESVDDEMELDDDSDEDDDLDDDDSDDDWE